MKRTERGWPGHYICSHKCCFRRNTLLEEGDKKVVVSTIGAYQNSDGDMDKIGFDRWYETMAFVAKKQDGYWDADVSKQVYPKGEVEWGIWGDTWEKVRDDVCNGVPDNVANDMHETYVNAIIASWDEIEFFNN